MNLNEWGERTMKRFKWYDVKLIQIMTMFATLFFITVWPALQKFVLGFEWYWYLLITVVLALPVLKKLFF